MKTINGYYKAHDEFGNIIILDVHFYLDVWSSHEDICISSVWIDDLANIDFFSLLPWLSESAKDDIKKFVFNSVEVEQYDENIHGNLDNDDNDGELVWKWK